MSTREKALNLLDLPDCKAEYEITTDTYDYPCGLRLSHGLVRGDVEPVAWQEAEMVHKKHHAHIGLVPAGAWTVEITTVREGIFTWFEGRCQHWGDRTYIAA